MSKEFTQLEWDERLEDDWRQLIRLAIREDLDRQYDLTTLALVGQTRQGRAAVVARQPGILAGMRAVPVLIDEMELAWSWLPHLEDGARLEAGTTVAEIHGAARDLLTGERLLLNVLGRLCGIATRTRAFVDAVAPHPAALYDTRKTTPGWRRLEKYAVRCGGGRNHRTGLFDAVLIKDNHLALAGTAPHPLGPGAAVQHVRQALPKLVHPATEAERLIIEVEVDTLDQLDQALSQAPDIVLLDNMSVEQLREAVRRRNGVQPSVQLEASGGIRLETIGQIAATGVDRISVGGLTHSAVSLDLGLDWLN